MNEIEIRPSTAEDIERTCGGKAPYTIKAFTVFLNNEPVCVAGIMFTSPPVIFSDFKRAKVPKKTIYRYARILLGELRALKVPAVTSALNGPSKFLESLGLEFDHKKENQYFYRI